MQFIPSLILAFSLAVPALTQIQYTSTKVEAIEAARATAKTLSPTSNIRGKTFDRFVQIWLENTDFSMAAADPSLASLATQGITLTNYKSLTHPSQPNYIGSVGGSTHVVLGDYFWRIIPSDAETIVDLLESKGVSWSLYQEDMPYSGFEERFPLMSYDSVTSVEDRLAKCKNFTIFYEDLKANTLPQWMFITPNMTNDGHDSSITVAGTWVKSFLEPLLSDPTFMQRTLVLLTFDEAENYFAENRVFSLLLGDAVPASLHNTTNDSAFNHYSIMSTVENNWDLGNLGEGDEDAKPFY